MDTTEIFIVALAGIAGVSALVIGRKVDPAWLLSAGVVVSVFSSNWSRLGVPVGLDRPLIAAGAVLLLLRLRDQRTRARLRLGWVHVLMAVVLAYAVGSAMWTGTLAAHEGVFALSDKLGAVPFLLFFLAPVAFGRPSQRSILLGMFVALGAYLGLTAFLEVAGIRSLVLPRYINDSTAGIHFGRARGPFLEAGADGLALFMCLVACAVARAVWASRLARAAAASAGVLCAIGIVLTLTRQVWVASVLATATTLAIVPSLRRYVVPAVLGSVACAALVIASVPGLQARAQDRAQSVRPVWDRLNSDRAALNMVAERPLLGFGWDSFPTESVNHYRLAAGYPLTTVDRVHNVLLGYAAELGLIGLTLWLATLAAAVSGMTRRGPPVVEPWRSGLIAIVVCWLVVSNFAPLAYAFPNYVLWLWAGIVYGALREPERGRDRARAVGRSVMVRQPQPA